MQELLSKLGIDWRLLLSQAVNFFILLGVLTYFVYKPIVKILKSRREKIEEGLVKSEEAEKRLRQIAEIQKEKIKEAEKKGLEVIKSAEKRGEEERWKILEAAKQEENNIMKAADERIRAKEEESERKVREEAARIAKAIIVKTVELSPEDIEDSLIEKAAREAHAV